MIDDSDDILVWDSTDSSISSAKDVDISEDNRKISDMNDGVAPVDVDICDIREMLPEEQEKEGDEDSNNSVYEKKYFKISEVESIIGETQSTIRFWEETFAELGKNFCSQRSRKGTRKFTKENIDNLKLLKLLLRERRLTIEGAIAEVKNAKRRNVKERAVILLMETKEELNNLIDAYNLILHQKC